MQPRAASSLCWPEVLAALRICTGESVIIRDGDVTAPAAAVRTRPSAKGTEFCLFSDAGFLTRAELIQRLEFLAKASGRRWARSARAKVNESYLLIEAVADENLDGVLFAVLKTRRPTTGFKGSHQTGGGATLHSKRVKTI
ncbi:MAG: hypothetical protein ACXWMY_02250 [Vulcanimicrobiaceae bacterium]